MEMLDRMRKLKKQLFTEDSSDEDEYYPPPQRQRWFQERRDWFTIYDDRDFVTRFRLTKSSALCLLTKIEDKLEYSSNRNASLSPMTQLLVTLRFYATGCSQLTGGDYIGASRSTVHRIVLKVSTAIAQLLPEHIKFPEGADKIKSEQIKFYNLARFPKVLGAMDCTHIRISSPGGQDAELFRNRKHYFSLNVQAICNANLEFTDIVARWPGSTHDSTIFNNCRCCARFESGEYDGFLLADAGYASSKYVMIPVPNPQTPAENLYNESQMRTRNPIERMFGLWKKRFPVLALGLRLKLQNIFAVIVATAVLHNILRQRGENALPDDPEILLPAPWAQLLQEGEIPYNGPPNRRHANDNARRILITNYFQSLL